ncbi:MULTISPECIES: hypothetical protein [unclassified Lysinibacillus]|uniref:hypothetical protein n=1 Tax=unclassified Lysinibacillus TaxID=2636778 RepID=UPI00088F40AE|nr:MULTISPECIES: hypothetical protein [unclassified Lysinibacillus]SCY97261.1 hypothetical protein SAMN02787078_03351 [Lysinibacillus sp. SG9]SDB45681.1 hypothetical protein SAMN02787079_03490 [Lysinibacillus sp. TC-37]SFT11349.1 hypothetical protein SAMN02787087_03670 [Lysinibacillus sp. SG55]
MRLFYQQKVIGKKSRKLQKIPFSIDEPVTTLQDLLVQLVTQQVQQFNEKMVDTPLHLYLTDQQLDDATQYGKVHFGEKKNDSLQSVDQAMSNMLQAFQDELFLVLHNEEWLDSLTTPLTIQEDDVFTFIKLTMLAGRIW